MHGLYLLWWVQEKQLSAAVVGTVLAAADFIRLGAEVPTGWFADRCGHRLSLLLGSVFQVAGMLMFWLGHGVPGLASAALLISLGDSFRSGADHALLFRTCAAFRSDNLFPLFLARVQALRLLAMVALVLCGGAIVQTWGYGVGWFVETTLAAGGAALAWLMVEPPAVNDGSARSPADDPATQSALHSSFRLWLLLIVPVALMSGVVSALSFFIQTDPLIGPARMSAFAATITLAEAAGAAAAARMVPVRRRLLIRVVGLALVCLAVVFASQASFIGSALCLAFLLGAAEPLRAGIIQAVAADDKRARMASLASACDMALAAVALPLAGRVRVAARRPSS